MKNFLAGLKESVVGHKRVLTTFAIGFVVLVVIAVHV